MRLFGPNVKKQAPPAPFRAGRGLSRGPPAGIIWLPLHRKTADSMITAYVHAAGMLKPVELQRGDAIPEAAVWIDVLSPEDEDLVYLDKALGLDVPTEEDMQEIEMSSRLYQEEDALYMTATMICNADTPEPQNVPVTFVLARQRLLTLRYAEPTPFRLFAAEAQRHTIHCTSGEEVLAGLLDAIVDRIADILQRVQADVETLSAGIFRHDGRTKRNYNEILVRIGSCQEMTARARESLASFGRLISFVARPTEAKRSKMVERSFKTIARDLSALGDHAGFIANNISFMLNATLGLINNEQTGIIKIFSVAAVVFLPPTLIASIYGMNFEFMPELAWTIGYPMSLGLMVLFAVLPYLFFKVRGWL